MARKAKKAKSKRKALVQNDIGVVHSGTSPRPAAFLKAFKDGLSLYSNINPRSPKYGKDKHGDLDQHARDLVAAGVTAIVAAGGSRASKAAMAATTSVPIIVTSISSAARPAPNVAGISCRTTGRDVDRLALLAELRPGRRNFGVLYDSSREDTADQRNLLDAKAALLGITLSYLPADANGTNADGQIDDAFSYWINRNFDGVVVAADPLFNNHMDTILAFANRMATIFQWREFADQGGLITYGPSLRLAYKLAGTFLGRLVTGTPIDQLPLLPLDSCELVINLVTAKALNIEVPYTLLARATDVVVG